MNIQIRMTRAENIARFGAGTVSLDIEEYLCGVVASEIYDTAAPAALRAQAIAARTYVLKRAKAGTVVGDTSGSQAYRYSRSETSPNSRQAVEATKGQVLCYDGKLVDCFYSASNGGVTKRSGDVWSRHYPYYVNAEEFMSSIRELRAAGVTVFFEKENKFTQNPANDFMLSLCVTIAQEESRNISVSVVWGLRRRMESGQVFLAYSNFLGYEKAEGGKLKIVEKEAAVVRKIYDMFLHGRTYKMIADDLTAKGYPTPAKKEKWSVSTVQSILKMRNIRGA